MVGESGQGVVELAAVAAIADAEVGGEFVDAVDAPLVVSVVVDGRAGATSGAGSGG